ncbi:MAG: site-specific DNA-methyltransferase [Planctomycetaceae bacterium]|jgi:adenine-specific DNA-methyltransferase|nr:site-specific DNA-methyltransferase [Planctomycetaceae bacterium]
MLVTKECEMGKSKKNLIKFYSEISNTVEKNKKVKANTDLLNTLKTTVPQFFDAEGNFKIDKFERELKEADISEVCDGYKLNFVGKDYARLQTGRVAETMIVPDCNHNNKPENRNSGNIFITGDNLEALRHLQNAYKNKIKIIYIDPPYNTSNEFVYNDVFEFDDDKLKNSLGYSIEEIDRLKSIQGKSSHSAWLTFMYPRLKIAQKLLTDDGVIFVSIDDNEQANLKLLLDDIFGEGNFVADFIVIRSEGGGLAKHAVIGHDYLLIFAKNISNFTPLGKAKKIRGEKVIKNNEEYWIETDWLRKKFGKYGICHYEEIIEYLGQKKKDEIDKGIENGFYVLIKKDNRHIVGRYRKMSDDISKFYTVLKHLNKNGKTDLAKIGLDEIFDYPKPVSLCKELISGATICNKDEIIILDFFAGSGTTAQAVLELNAEDGGNRKFILVQIDEPANPESIAYKAGYKTIDQIARKRIMVAGVKTLDEYNSKQAQHCNKTKIDNANNTTSWNKNIGFKHYRLMNPNVRTIDKILEFDPNDEKLIESDMITPFAYPATRTDGISVLLSTWMIADGFNFETQAEKINFANYQAHYVKDAATLYLINQNWNTKALEVLLHKIRNNELTVNTIIVYPYSFLFRAIRELKTNIKTNLTNPPAIIDRYY